MFCDWLRQFGWCDFQCFCRCLARGGESAPPSSAALIYSCKEKKVSRLLFSGCIFWFGTDKDSSTLSLFQPLIFTFEEMNQALVHPHLSLIILYSRQASHGRNLLEYLEVKEEKKKTPQHFSDALYVSTAWENTHTHARTHARTHTNTKTSTSQNSISVEQTSWNSAAPSCTSRLHTCRMCLVCVCASASLCVWLALSELL